MHRRIRLTTMGYRAGGHLDDGLGEVHLLQNDRVVLDAERLSRGRVLCVCEFFFPTFKLYGTVYEPELVKTFTAAKNVLNPISKLVFPVKCGSSGKGEQTIDVKHDFKFKLNLDVSVDVKSNFKVDVSADVKFNFKVDAKCKFKVRLDVTFDEYFNVKLNVTVDANTNVKHVSKFNVKYTFQTSSSASTWTSISTSSLTSISKTRIPSSSCKIPTSSSTLR